MEKISLFTAILDSALVSGVTGVLLLLCWRFLSQSTPLLFWGAAQLAWSMATVLMAARGVVPDSLSILVANGLAVASMLLLWCGMASFVGRGVPLAGCAIVMGVYWFSFPILTYGIPDIAARIVVVRALMLTGIAGALWCLWRPAHLLRSATLLARVRLRASLGMVPLIVTLGLSMAVTIYYWKPDAAFFRHPIIIGSVFGMTVAMLIWALVMVYLVIEERTIARRTSGEMHRFLLDQTVAPMFIAQNQRLVYVNKAFADMFGYEADELVEEKVLADLIAPSEQMRLSRALQRFDAGEVRETHPKYKVIRSDGAMIDVAGQVRIIPEGDGVVMVGMIQDVTAQEEARQKAVEAQQLLEQTVKLRTAELQREVQTRTAAEAAARIFRMAVEQVDTAVMLIDLTGRVVHANGACHGIVRRTIDMAQRLDGRDLSGDEPLQWSVKKAISRGEIPWTGEVRVDRAMTVAATVSPLRTDGADISHYIVIATDISERVRVNEQMAEAKLAAEQNSRAKSEFLANMSHELRTPLNAIIGFSEMISGQIWGPVGDPHYKDYAHDIESSASHLLAVINDVLDIAAVEQGTLGLDQEWCSLQSILASSIRLIEPRASASKLTVSLDMDGAGSVEVLADPRRLKQIVLNLLSNSVKFTAAGGEVVVSVGEIANGGVRIAVNDTGIGMDPKGIVAALQRFGQVDSSLSRAWEGTGLGLPLASELTSMHGGALAIESALGQGTCVTVTFPADRCRWGNEQGAVRVIPS